MRRLSLGIVAARNARDVAHRIITERLGQVLRRRRVTEIAGYSQPLARVITKLSTLPMPNDTFARRPSES